MRIFFFSGHLPGPSSWRGVRVLVRVSVTGGLRFVVEVDVERFFGEGSEGVDMRGGVAGPDGLAAGIFLHVVKLY